MAFTKIAESQDYKPGKMYLILKACVMLNRGTLELFQLKQKALFKGTIKGN